MSDFASLYGHPPTVAAEAPGRVNLIGEHTDYNGGYVLPTAIPLRTRVELAPRADRMVRVWSANVPKLEQPAGYRLGEEQRRGDWLDYVQGLTVALAANHAVEPALAGTRTLREFARAVAARVPPDAELRFVGPVNGGMRLYLARPLPMARRPMYQADDPQRCRYLLVWKSRWPGIRPETRAQLVPVLKSAGSGPEGDDRLLLVRVRSAACGERSAGSPIACAGAACEHVPHERALRRDLRRLARDRAPGRVSAAHRRSLS